MDDLGLEMDDWETGRGQWTCRCPSTRSSGWAQKSCSVSNPASVSKVRRRLMSPKTDSKKSIDAGYR